MGAGATGILRCRVSRIGSHRESAVITILVITLATLVVLACAACFVIVWAANKIADHLDYMSQRLESELIELCRRLNKP